jgi:hypothetical protein
VVEEIVRCDKQSSQKGVDLSLLNRLVFQYLIVVEKLLKCAPVFLPRCAIWQKREGEIPLHSGTNKESLKGCGEKEYNTHSSTIMGNRIRSE